jgi:tRNA dimethylallyltransferase
MALKSNPVIFVVGATATGKTEWALQMAQKFGGVIVNCDSVQVYREVEIGTAKPSVEERAKVPFYLIDYVSPPDEMTAGQYCRDFFEQMTQLAENKPVFVVGGTGFYFQAIEKGMYPVAQIPPEIQQDIEETLEKPGGPEALHAELLRLDPIAGQKIHPADHYRIARAVELMRSHGKTLTEIRLEFSQRKSDFPYPLLKIGLRWDREQLRGRILARTEKMLERGLIGEVRSLLKKNLIDWAPLSSVGYMETIEFLEGHLNEKELVDLIAQNTSQLAKRQRTWFQRDQEIQWFDGGSEFDRALMTVESFIQTKKETQ